MASTEPIDLLQKIISGSWGVGHGSTGPGSKLLTNAAFKTEGDKTVQNHPTPQLNTKDMPSGMTVSSVPTASVRPPNCLSPFCDTWPLKPLSSRQQSLLQPLVKSRFSLPPLEAQPCWWSFPYCTYWVKLFSLLFAIDHVARCSYQGFSSRSEIRRPDSPLSTSSTLHKSRSSVFVGQENKHACHNVQLY